MKTYTPATNVLSINTDRLRQISAHILADRIKNDCKHKVQVLEIRHLEDSVIDTLIIKINDESAIQEIDLILSEIPVYQPAKY